MTSQSINPPTDSDYYSFISKRLNEMMDEDIKSGNTFHYHDIIRELNFDDVIQNKDDEKEENKEEN